MLASNMNDQTPITRDASLSVTLLSQSDVTSGVRPSSNPGTISSIVQMMMSFAMLISTSKLPAIDSNERCFVLEASSSISPRRGSMTGFMRLISLASFATDRPECCGLISLSLLVSGGGHTCQ